MKLSTRVCLASAVAFLCTAPMSAQVRSDKGGLQLRIASERLVRKEGPATIRRFPLLRGTELGFGVLRGEGSSAVLERPSEPALTLPLRLEVTVSRDGKVVLQHGDSLMRMHPTRTNLYWIGAKGEITAQVQNRYAGSALLDMSPDGYTAVAGRDYFKTHEERAVNGEKGDDEYDHDGDHESAPWHVDLYAPSGERMWEAEVAADRDLTLVRALPGRKGVLARTADHHDPLADHALLLWRGPAEAREIDHDFRIIQAVVILGDGSSCFVQGIDGHGVIELRRGATLWTRPEPIRMVSHDAAAQGVRGELLVMTGVPAEEPGHYVWTLRVLAGRTGEPLGQLRLPKAYPGAREQVFARVESGAVTVFTGEAELKIDLSRR